MRCEPPAGPAANPSTCSSSAAGSPVSAWRSTPPHAACAPRSSSATTSPSGTSSKSSKMVHGGLRYLQQGDVRLVYEALRERHRLMRNAPHLVEVLPFMIPILTKDGVVSKKMAKALGSAMWMYDLTGGWRIGKLHKRVSGEQAARHFPTTHLDKLSAGYLYYDAGVDDARLTLTVARTAAPARCGDRESLRRRRHHHRRRRSGQRRHRRGRRTNASTCRRDASSTPPGCGPTRCEPSTRAPTPTRSDRPRACTSRSRGRRFATTSPSSSRFAATSAACSWCRGASSPTARSDTSTSAPPTPTTTDRSTTRSARATTSTTSSTALNQALTETVTATTSPACGPGCVRW